MTVIIRPLRVDEAALYRDIRLEALRTHPEAFGASFEQEAARPLGFFAERLSGQEGMTGPTGISGNVIFGGFQDAAVLAIAGFIVQSGLKREHKGTLWGMYVRPEARGTGLASLLVEAVLDHARDRVELIQLSVIADNVIARRLYASLGFEPYGIEERALKVEGRYLDEVLMAKLLR